MNLFNSFTFIYMDVEILVMSEEKKNLVVLVLVVGHKNRMQSLEKSPQTSKFAQKWADSHLSQCIK